MVKFLAIRLPEKKKVSTVYASSMVYFFINGRVSFFEGVNG
jgi:hypothetical protein